MCAPKWIAAQLATLGLVVQHDNRLDAPAGQGGDGGEADRTGADDDGHLALLDLCRPHVELADGERVGQRGGVARDVGRDGFGRHFRNHQQLSEAPRRLRVLTDDPHAAGTAVDQAYRYGSHPGADGELIRAAGPMPDHLADELVAEHDVLIRVIQRAPRRIIEAEIRVVHEVHVRCTDRGAQCPQQQLTRSGLWVRRIPDL